jgi:transposase
LVNKFKTTGLVLDKKTKGRCHILNEEKLHNIGARLEHSQRKSLAKPAQQADILVSSARTATKLL